MKRFLPTVIACVVVFASWTHVVAQSNWQVGSDFALITPQKPMWMAGYASRNKPSEGVASDLYAKAVVLDDGQKNKAAIITFDLISVPRG